MRDFITLKRNKDFRRLYSKGKSFVSPILVTYVSKNKVGYLRVGITTSKKVGKAVQRNRSRRIIREAFYQIDLPNNTGFDIVFVARGKTPFVKTSDIFKVMEKHLIKENFLMSSH